MKASGLIAKIQAQIDLHGDLPISCNVGHGSSGYIEDVTHNPAVGHSAEHISIYLD